MAKTDYGTATGKCVTCTINLCILMFLYLVYILASYSWEAPQYLDILV